MDNVSIKREGTKLVLTVDLARDCGMSKSGKNLLIGTTGGTHKAQFDGKPISIGLNVWTEPKAVEVPSA